MKISLRILFIFFLIHTVSSSTAQRIALLEVILRKEDTSNLIIPLQTNLDELTTLTDSSLELLQVEGSMKTPVPFQVYSNTKRWLCWTIKNTKANKGKIVFELNKKTADQSQQKKHVSINIKDSTVIISSGTSDLLHYVFGTFMPSTGDISKDSLFSKSGFIHPLNTPHLQALTRVSPPDHFHHYGLWNAWTHVLFEGDTIDTWNLAYKKGTVKFNNLLSVTEGPVFAEYTALDNVIAYLQGSEKNMLNEIQTVRVYVPDPLDDYYIVNISEEINCASESPVLLKEYSYSGLGWRATELWNRNNSEVLTSEGKTRPAADGSTARWCMVQGKLGNDYGGAVMMSYPANFNHPEPLRISPENIFDRGDMFANFSPTKNKDWFLLPGKTYLLRYQFLVFNNQCSKEKAEAAWQHFAHPPAIIIKPS